MLYSSLDVAPFKLSNGALADNQQLISAVMEHIASEGDHSNVFSELKGAV